MRETIMRNQPDRIKTRFLWFPKTLPYGSYKLEARWLERTSWVERWTGYGPRNLSGTPTYYQWDAIRWANPEEVLLKEIEDWRHNG